MLLFEICKFLHITHRVTHTQTHTKTHLLLSKMSKLRLNANPIGTTLLDLCVSACWSLLVCWLAVFLCNPRRWRRCSHWCCCLFSLFARLFVLFYNSILLGALTASFVSFFFNFPSTHEWSSFWYRRIRSILLKNVPYRCVWCRWFVFKLSWRAIAMQTEAHEKFNC